MYFCTDMSVLENFVPKIALPFLEKWFGDHICHLKITPNRQSKLGDYRLLPDGSHQISVNGTLDSELFFFVLTHELAHLISFHEKEKSSRMVRSGNLLLEICCWIVFWYILMNFSPLSGIFLKALKPILCRVRIWLNISIKREIPAKLM